MPAIKAFTRHRLSLRSHSAQVLTWGDPKNEPVLMLHGWMDVASSFQFLVDAMQHDWYVIAPDQRGYGGSDWTREAASGYWFADYVLILKQSSITVHRTHRSIWLATASAAMSAARTRACARIA